MKIKVTCEVEVPMDATKEQITEWVRFNLSQSGSLSRNPLLEHPCKEIWKTIVSRNSLFEYPCEAIWKTIEWEYC
jgi:hypothetical protein